MKLTSLFLFALPLALVACSAAPADDGAESSDDALKKIDFGGSSGELAPLKPPKTPRPPKTPVKDPVVPPAPSCSYTPGSAEIDWLSPEDNAIRVALGCDAAFRYTNGAGAGFLGGIFSRCPDTAAVRAQFHGGFPATYGDACLAPAGSGKVYAMWSGFVGPNCPSGCNIGEAPLW